MTGPVQIAQIPVFRILWDMFCLHEWHNDVPSHQYEYLDLYTEGVHVRVVKLHDGHFVWTWEYVL